jgi:UDP-N-acetylmuramoyl-L-alanyl-D-glutamate--2,6-diaminopimelate ligase
MEATSIAVELGRVDGLEFDTVAFTNLTRDHLDFHGSMEDYFASKRKLFTGAVGPEPRCAVLNTDDEYGRRLADSLSVRTITFGLGDYADVRARSYELTLDGLEMSVVTPEGSFDLRSPLVGRPYVYNILTTIGIARSLGYSLEVTRAALESCEGAPGRFERVPSRGGFAVVVDYAHTDDALRKVLETARELTRGRLITVFGCGGDRDRTKRAPMGLAAGSLSDLAILTSDNPRSEDPLQIIEDAENGLAQAGKPYETYVDRAEAIGVPSTRLAKATSS